jgi:hypothetical protein
MTTGVSSTVYKLRFSEGYEWILPVQESDFQKLRFDGTHWAKNWQPVRMKRLKQSEQGTRLQPSDFPACSGGDMLVVSRTAKETIGEQLQKYGELLPLQCDEGEFWILNVTVLLDVLDEGASKVLRASDTGEVLLVQKPAFKVSALQGAGLFKVAQAPRGPIYVTEQIAELVGKSKLRGMEFVEVWAAK